jgi:hopanoid C-2 methylase
MRSSIEICNGRRILCVFPAYTPSFGTFSHAYRLMYRVRAFMPPQGLLLIAAYLPKAWTVRFIDENIRPATTADFGWADVVLVSGMHVQAPQIRDIHKRAKAAGKVVVLGGPSVSSAPDMYPDIDYLHIGEIGDATEQIIAHLDNSVAPPAVQMRFETRERLPLGDFPIPAYDLIPLPRYLIGSIQFSSGCPYRCEFCDIPGLYGRQPRFKSPEQLIAELDAMCKHAGHPPAIYFVDDNFIGNRKAAREMLPHLIAWQKQHGYPLEFACEATLNIAKHNGGVVVIFAHDLQGIGFRRLNAGEHVVTRARGRPTCSICWRRWAARGGRRRRRRVLFQDSGSGRRWSSGCSGPAARPTGSSDNSPIEQH